MICRIQNPAIPRAARGGAAHGGAAGRGGDGQDGTPTRRFAQNTIVFSSSQTMKKPSGTCLWRHEQTKFYLNRWGTRPTVDKRLTRGTTAALRSWLLSNVTTLVGLCKPCSRKACLGEGLSLSFGNRLVECKTRTYHGQVGASRGRAAHGGARQSRAGQDADGFFRPGDNRPCCPQGHRKITV